MSQPHKWKNLERPSIIIYISGAIIFLFALTAFVFLVDFALIIKYYLPFFVSSILIAIFISAPFSLFFSYEILKGKKRSWLLLRRVSIILSPILLINSIIIIYYVGMEIADLILIIPPVSYAFIFYIMKKPMLKDYFGISK